MLDLQQEQVHVGDPPRSSDERFMEIALGLARKAVRAGELPIGAIVVSEDQRVISRAYCSDKRRRRLAHPELLVLLSADRKVLNLGDRKGATLYTTLEPCLMCLGAAMSFSLGRIVYAAAAPGDGGVSRLFRLPFGDATCPEYRMPAIVGGVLGEESRLLFQAFIARSMDPSMAEFARGVVEGGQHNAGPTETLL